MADAAGPERFRHDFFADVEILRGLVRAAAEAASIDEESLSVRGDEEKRVALADVDGFHEQCVVGMLEGTRDRGGESGDKKRGQGCAALPLGTAYQKHGRGEERAEDGGLPEERRGDAQIAEGE